MAIFDVLKSVANILKEADKIKEYSQILEVQKELLEMQKRVQELEKENSCLKEKLSIKENLDYEKNAYWAKKENGTKDGPFCSRCWDKNRDLIRLDVSNVDIGFCPECKNSYHF